VTAASLAQGSSVPAKCAACDAAIPSGRDRCPNCGKVYGEWNRCPSCRAIAAVHEARRGVYVCAACSAPRKRQRGTPVDSQFADELWRRSLMTRVGSWALLPVGAGLLGLSAMVLGVGQIFEAAVAYASVFGGVLGVLGISALYFARRLGRRARALTEQARREKLLSHVMRARAAITAGEAAQALHLRPIEADAALTDLAKSGRIDLDVDDAGTVRYRVLSEEDRRRRGLTTEADDAEALGPRDSARLKR